MKENNPLANKLSDIEFEISELSKQRDELKAHWQIEKDLINKIRNDKEEIEKLKSDAEKFERSGDLDKVAEIRYGKLINIQKRIENNSKRLNKLQSEKKMLKEEVDSEDIAEILSKWTAIPVAKMLESEREKLLCIEDNLHKRIIGQDEAISAIANAIRRSRAGLQDSLKPIGSFIFMGTTGVGKTELAKTLAEFLFDDEHNLIRIDMSEYMEKFSVSRLIGAPPGYVGYEEGGQLTEAVRRKPYSVILFDEIEKAHQDVYNILLQILDDGILTDSQGRTVNFKNTIVIMTSNIGSQLIHEQLLMINEENKEDILGNLKEELILLLRAQIRPEILNRIDEIIMFKPLFINDIKQIVELQFNILQERILDSNEIHISISEEAKEWLGKIGYDITFGARPLKRTIQKYITNPVSEKIIKCEINKFDKIMIDLGIDGRFIFKKL